MDLDLKFGSDVQLGNGTYAPEGWKGGNHSFVELYRKSKVLPSIFKMAQESRESRLARVVLVVRVPVRTGL